MTDRMNPEDYLLNAQKDLVGASGGGTHGVGPADIALTNVGVQMAIAEALIQIRDALRALAGPPDEVSDVVSGPGWGFGSEAEFDAAVESIISNRAERTRERGVGYTRPPGEPTW